MYFRIFCSCQWYALPPKFAKMASAVWKYFILPESRVGNCKAKYDLGIFKDMFEILEPSEEATNIGQHNESVATSFRFIEPPGSLISTSTSSEAHTSV